MSDTVLSFPEYGILLQNRVRILKEDLDYMAQDDKISAKTNKAIIEEDIKHVERCLEGLKKRIKEA